MLLRRTALLLALAWPAPALAADFALPADDPSQGEQALAPPPAAPADLSADVKRWADALAALPAAEHEVEALAATFNGDARAAYAWVRDTIRLDAYAGHLRTPHGVLAARAGNAVDRALLLKALLDTMKVKTRFALADLGDAEQALLAGSVPVPRGAPVSAEPAFNAAFLDRVRARAGRDYALLSEILGADRIAQMASGYGEDWRALLSQHVWLEAELDGQWVALDTSRLAVEPGEALSASPQTMDALPDETAQTVTLTVSATLAEGEKELLTLALPAAEAAESRILLTFGAAEGGLGASITGSTDIAPYLTVDGQSTKGEGFPSGAAASGGVAGAIDVLGGDGTAPEGPRAVTLRIVTAAPGQAPVEMRRVLAAAPEGGTLPSDEQGPLAWRAVHQIIVSTGGASVRDDLQARIVSTGDAIAMAAEADPFATRSLDQVLWPIMVANRALALASERIVLEAISGDVPEGPRIRAYVGRPRVTIMTMGPAVEGQWLAEIDLAIDGFMIAATGGREQAQRRLWYGAVQSSLETETALMRAINMHTDSRTGASASLVMESGELRVIDAAGDVPAGAPEAMRAQAENARIVVAGDPVSAQAWWTIAPDGTARAVLNPALGGVSLRGYVNAARGGTTYVVDEATGNTIAEIRDGVTRMRNRPPPKDNCKGGPEYVVIMNCVSIPASYTTGQAVAIWTAEAIIIAIVSLWGG